MNVLTIFTLLSPLGLFWVGLKSMVSIASSDKLFIRYHYEHHWAVGTIYLGTAFSLLFMLLELLTLQNWMAPVCGGNLMKSMAMYLNKLWLKEVKQEWCTLIHAVISC